MRLVDLFSMLCFFYHAMSSTNLAPCKSVIVCKEILFSFFLCNSFSILPLYASKLVTIYLHTVEVNYNGKKTRLWRQTCHHATCIEG